MSRYSYSLPHSAEVVNIFMTNNIIEEPKYNKKETLKINETEFYYIENERWKNIIMINDKAYIKFENKFIHRNKCDHQMLSSYYYSLYRYYSKIDIYYVKSLEAEGYYSPTKLKINKEHKHNINYEDSYNLSYIEDTIKEIKSGDVKNIKFGSLVKYYFSLKNGVYNNGDLLVYNDYVYYNVPLSLPLDVKLIEFKTIFGEVDLNEETDNYNEEEDIYDMLEDLDCEVCSDIDEYYNKLNDERKRELLFDIINDFIIMDNCLNGGVRHNISKKILFIIEEVIKMIPEYFNKLCDSFYYYQLKRKIYLLKYFEDTETKNKIDSLITTEFKETYIDLLNNINKKIHSSSFI